CLSSSLLPDPAPPAIYPPSLHDALPILDGKPLSSGSVAFHPDAKKGNSLKKILGGEIGSDSTYRIYTDGQPGAPAGWYKVTVVRSEEPTSELPPLPQLLSPLLLSNKTPP